MSADPRAAGAPPQATAHPAAELDRRFSAYAVDRVVCWGIAGGVAFAAYAATDDVATTILTFVGAAVLLGLVVAVLVGTTGLTPGKAAVGLRVVRQDDGRPIGVLAGLGRTLALGVAGLPTLGLGAATLAWTAAMDPTGRRRGVHDRIGDAVVVDVRPVPVVEEPEDQRPQQLVNLTAMRLMPVPQAAEVPTPPDVQLPQVVSAPPATDPRPASRPPVPAYPPPPPVAPPPVPATQLRGVAPGVTARWRVTFDTGEQFVVEGLALVGRRPEPRPDEPVRHLVPLPSSDMSLSKTHAQFQVAPDGALVVMDRGSTNGTYVVRRGHSRTLNPGRPSTLVDGDVVRFGDRTMRVAREN